MMFGMIGDTEKKHFAHRYPQGIAIVLAALCCLILITTLDDYGVTWDEPLFLKAGRSYLQWILNPSFDTIDASWEIMAEHPPLHKILGGLTRYIFYEKLSWTDELSSYRLSTVLFAFLLLSCLHRFAAQLYGTMIASLVTLGFFFMPHVFFHAHLGALDYSVTALIFAASYAYWKSLTHPRWIFICAVFLGLGFLTKLNIFFVYIPIFALFIMHHWSMIKVWLVKRTWDAFIPMLRMVKRQWPIIAIPPVMFVALWPWMWTHTFPKIFSVFSYHWHHFRVPVLYFKEIYYQAPWHYPFVLVLIATPLLALLALSIGLIFFRKLPDLKAHVFLVFSMLVPLVLIALPGVPKYDGIRLFLPAFPFLFILSGAGLWIVCQWLRGGWSKNIILMAYGALYALTVVTAIYRLHPSEMIYYNEFVGGVSGAFRHGFETEFWGSSYLGVVDWLNDHADRTYHVPIANHLLEEYYKQSGALKLTISFGPLQSSDYMVLLMRQGMMGSVHWKYFTTKKPVFSLTASGIPLINIYKVDH